MKNTDQIMVTFAQVKLLFGVSVTKAERMFLLKKTGGGSKIPLSAVSNIIDGKSRSYDPRFDGIDKADLMVDMIRERGLPRSIAAKALNSKSCIKRKALVGVYAVFNDILTDEQLMKIKDNLRYKYDYLYG